MGKKNKKERLEQGNKKARKVYQAYYSHFSDEEFDPKRFGELRKTRKFCSSPECCGNPRRMRGQDNRTIKEKICNIKSLTEME